MNLKKRMTNTLISSSCSAFVTETLAIVYRIQIDVLNFTNFSWEIFCRSNKKMFELFTIHLMIQELQRTAHPEHAFLCINLNSILFNLGLTKGSLLANTSQ